ncbi:MAG: TolC family protein [Deltaproteobacteria bacterium]|nr:TolC family protein [Deltaproteobacteria bacterium]
MINRPSLLKGNLIIGVLVALLCLLSSPLQASVLNELVDEALSNNPGLAASKARWQQATYRAPQAGSLKDPVISFTLSNYPHDNFSNSDTPMTGNEVRLAQAFPFPGKLGSRSDLAKEQARWFEAVYHDKHFQLARQVKDAWYRLYFKGQAIAVTERNMALVDDVIRLTVVRYETGTGLQQDVLKAQVQRSRLMEQLMSLSQQKSVIQAELNNLLNRPSGGTYDIPGELDLVTTENSLQTFQNAGIEKRPLNAAYRSLIERYRYQKKLAKLDDYPDMTLWASWRFRDDELVDGGTDFVSAGISFNLPVYRDKRRAASAEARAALRMAERQLEDFKGRVVQSIQNAYSRMEETHQQAELYRDGIIPQTSQSFQAAMGSYQVGKVAFISLLDALMTTYQAEMEYYRISSEYMRSLAWLEAESTLPLIGPALKIADQKISTFTE